MKLIIKIFALSCFLLLTACSAGIPDKSQKIDKTVRLYPDYMEIIIPYNIAPLNFVVKEEGNGCAVKISDENNNSIIVSGGKKMEVRFPEKKWKRLLTENKGKYLTYDIFVKQGGGWVQYNSFKNKVAEETIDPYLTYRLIEPSHRTTGGMGLFQFNMETAEEKTIIVTPKLTKVPEVADLRCVNCHTSKGSDNLFYSRGKGGGMILTYQGKTYKVNTKVGDMFAPTIYPAWHPFLPLIAFSTNEIGQIFIAGGPKKIEVLDFRSDLVLYDIEKNEITHIFKTKNKRETNPNWSPDGKYLYFCSSDSVLKDPREYASIKYDIKRVSFDQEGKTWGEVETVYDASGQGRSATYPRVSPDGRYLLFVISSHGCSPYTHPDADLYLMNLETGETRPLTEANSPQSDGYIDWSSEGRWFVVSSRREDGNYPRPYFVYFDKEGNAHKPFVIPRKDPMHNDNMMKGYNVPQFATVPVSVSQKKLKEVIAGPVIDATYGSEMGEVVDGQSGASVVDK
jgi:WD40 repeat protein